MIKKFNDFLVEGQTSLTPAQIEWLDEYCLMNWPDKRTWRVNPSTGLVDIDGDFDCTGKNLKNFNGLRFGEVRGSFNLSENNFTSLEGSPQEVEFGFYCRQNLLTSLKGSPRKVGGDFQCGGNDLTSLQGAPEEVGGQFSSWGNKISSLKGVPIIKGHFRIGSTNPISSVIFPYEKEINDLDISSKNMVLQMISQTDSPKNLDLEKIILAAKRMEIL